MAFCNQTKIPKLCLVYFRIDQTTCIVETKKLRSKDSCEPFSCVGPKRGAEVAVRCTGKLLDAMVIALDGKLIILSILGCFEVNWVPDFVFYVRQGLTSLISLENEEKLNQEDRSFVEDPANSHLFDQQEMGEDDRSIVETHSHQSAKGAKAANNQCEVRGPFRCTSIQ